MRIVNQINVYENEKETIAVYVFGFDFNQLRASVADR